MSKNIIKHSSVNWYCVKEFDRIYDIDRNGGIYISNSRIIETDLTGAARNAMEITNGFNIYGIGDFVDYRGRHYTTDNLDQLRMVIENEKTEIAINGL